MPEITNTSNLTLAVTLLLQGAELLTTKTINPKRAEWLISYDDEKFREETGMDGFRAVLQADRDDHWHFHEYEATRKNLLESARYACDVQKETENGPKRMDRT